eukprot:6203254-Pleurochrysis_carterae.AAC.1
MAESTVLRMVNKKRKGLAAYAESDAHKRRKLMDTEKTLSVVSWWRGYANETSEKLPDMDMLMTPHRQIRDIHE